MKRKTKCENPDCNEDIVVMYCCNGYECGCMGMPIDPPICSKKCYQEMIEKGIYKYED